MLDAKSLIVLKILVKECKNGGYKIVESRDIISAMPEKFKVDYDGLKNILTFLEHSDCISIKYDDDGVFCLCVLPYGYKMLENKVSQKKKATTFPFWIYILILFSVIIASFIGSLLAKLVA